MLKCSKCIDRRPMVTELMHMFQDGDPIRMMEILIDVSSQESALQLLTADDHRQINNLHHLLGEIARQQKEDALSKH